MTRPPAKIEHEGYWYRRIGPVERPRGRPAKPGGRPARQPRVIAGAEEWYCPCCEEWKEGDEFGVDNNACSGLNSWCLDCRREDQQMRRAIHGGGELGDSWRDEKLDTPPGDG